MRRLKKQYMENPHVNLTANWTVGLIVGASIASLSGHLLEMAGYSSIVITVGSIVISSMFSWPSRQFCQFYSNRRHFRKSDNSYDWKRYIKYVIHLDATSVPFGAVFPLVSGWIQYTLLERFSVAAAIASPSGIIMAFIMARIVHAILAHYTGAHNHRNKD